MKEKVDTKPVDASFLFNAIIEKPRLFIGKELVFISKDHWVAKIISISTKEAVITLTDTVEVVEYDLDGFLDFEEIYVKE